MQYVISKLFSTWVCWIKRRFVLATNQICLVHSRRNRTDSLQLEMEVRGALNPPCQDCNDTHGTCSSWWAVKAGGAPTWGGGDSNRQPWDPNIETWPSTPACLPENYFCLPIKVDKHWGKNLGNSFLLLNCCFLAHAFALHMLQEMAQFALGARWQQREHTLLRIPSRNVCRMQNGTRLHFHFSPKIQKIQWNKKHIHIMRHVNICRWISCLVIKIWNIPNLGFLNACL